MLTEEETIMLNGFKGPTFKAANFASRRIGKIPVRTHTTKHFTRFPFFHNKKQSNIATFKVGGRTYHCGTSKEEDAWLTKLGVFQRQKVIFGYSGKIMVVDGIDYSKRIVFEYLGAYCHSIRAYPKQKWDIPTWMGKTPREMYNETVNRFKFLHANSWKVFFVWDYEFKKGQLGRLYRGGNDDLY